MVSKAFRFYFFNFSLKARHAVIKIPSPAGNICYIWVIMQRFDPPSQVFYVRKCLFFFFFLLFSGGGGG